ncbi:hypothetical protein I3760_13G177600 [Carya illinoinensis]|uniref:Kinesin motor domain-containing protein n=2 Tax=Carya illinoinensis TaxID=32201 RepID=A0A922DF05_CARIL|nr:hypothetical protein I3760_13G177600 [Carya illinoinensis]KAG6683176.1 hypothetical protein I3842_13G178500 [Carya illinoinensis]
MPKRTKAMEARKSVQNLAEKIHSLLGLKAHFTSSWVKSVCDIIRHLPSEGPSIDLKAENSKASVSFGNKEDDLASEISKIKDELAALTANINQLNIQRRQVLNDFLDLKGNIRVFCRIRPVALGENFGNIKPIVAMDSSYVLLRLSDNKSRCYSFDKIFLPGSSQDEVFSEVKPVIKSALDGYNACIFAYGQTGTGKTFTMEGSPDLPGVVPRAIEALFREAVDCNHAFLFTFSMLEIYMGNLKDLLITQPRKAMDPMPPCLSIKTDPKGGIEIDNLVALQVSDFNQALRLYRLGCQSRSTASTNCNTSSSRSHCLIRLSITSFDAPERQRETNKVWFIDLGGSERVLKTKAWGRRLEEGKAINLSLSALGNVINALQRKKFHVPYRNSKLTQVLKDSLGESSKTLMLVHVSPREEDLCETICSLNFATRAKSIHLGTEESTEERDQRGVTMMNLQQKIKMIEEERRNIKRNIEKLNEKLDTLARRGTIYSQELNAPHLTSGLPQPNLEILRSKTSDVPISQMSLLPRFMRPTICSRRKSGLDQQNSEDKQEFHARRRRPLSHRAESVTFPVKCKSDHSSEFDTWRSSCLLAFNMNADIETEYSQDTSECDIEGVVFPEQETLPGSSINPNAHIGHSQQYGNRLESKYSSTRFLNVENWLHLHKKEPFVITNSSGGKRVLATPIPEKKCSSYGQKKESKLKDDTRDTCSFKINKIVYHKMLNKQADVEGFRRSVLEEVINKPQPLFEDCLSKDSRSGSGCLLNKPDGDMTIQTQDLVHGPSIIDNECDTSFMLCDLDYSIGNPKEEPGISFSSPQLEPHCQQVPTGTDVEDGMGEDLDTLSQSSMTGRERGPQKLRSHIALFMVNPHPEELTGTYVRSQEYAQNRGICHLLKQKIQMVFASALLGLGFQKLGFEHDFFHGLML